MSQPAEMKETGSWLPSETLISRIKCSYRMALNNTHPSQDSKMASWIKRSYQKVTRKEVLLKESARWSTIASKQKDIHNALLSDDQSAAELLSNPAKTNLYYGVDNLAEDIVAKMTSTCEGSGQELRKMVETLVIAIGQNLILNPQGGEKFRDKSSQPSLSTEEYLQKINSALGMEVRFPNPFAGELGIKTTQGMISYRAIPAIYQAYRMRQICHFTEGYDCLEIGAGMGRTVFYAHQLGLRCTVIDLPMTIVGQALFLSAALGEDAIWMLGDTMPKENRILLLPPSELDTLERDFNVVLNSDSLTEMGRETALDYMKYIENHAQFFISINHEFNHFTIKEISALTSTLMPLSRCLYWLREGYVEEVFSVRKKL